MSTAPNILIVMTDHQRADTILPEHPALTPNLDRFTSDAVTFTNAYCPSPHCCPSRATFFTGGFPPIFALRVRCGFDASVTIEVGHSLRFCPPL